MNEPLFDGLTAVAAVLAIGAVWTLRSVELSAVNADRAKQRHIVGLVLLALSVGALVFRWIDSVSALPSDLGMGSVRQGMLTAVCGFGVAVALLSVTAVNVVARVKSFLTVAACGTIALLLAAAWEWALLWIALLAFGAWAVMSLTSQDKYDAQASDPTNEVTLTPPSSPRWIWAFARRRSSPEATGTIVRRPDNHRDKLGGVEVAASEAPRERGLIMLAAAGLLVLLLGTWQHVVENEGQRQTRSKRYSAWPRATALANAWERSGWVVRADEDDQKQPDRKSAELVSSVAAREQRIAWGLGAMLLVLTGVAWRQSRWLPICEASSAEEEAPHGS